MLRAKEPAANPYIAEVNRTIRDILQKDFKVPLNHSDLLYASAAHLVVSDKAKRARPFLASLFAESLSLDVMAMVPIAVAAEFVHAASLLHDDVIDNADSRRGKPTINAIHDNTVAVLTGDLLYTMALDILRPLRPEISDTAVQVVRNMTIAAALEYGSRGTPNPGRNTWNTIAIGKTGDLFAWCGTSAAFLAKQEDAVESFRLCGEKLGLAFQMADDLKDFFSASEEKPRYADLRNRNPNLLLILACEEDSTFKESLQQMYSKESDEGAIRAAAKKILQSEIPQRAFSLMDQTVAEALEALGKYRSTEGGQKLDEWVKALYTGFAPEIKMKFKKILSRFS